MTLPSTHRWVILGSLIIRKPKRISDDAPDFTLTEVMEHAKANNDNHQEFGKDKSRIMWLSNLSENDDFYYLLAERGDKNVTGVSFLNFDTKDTRDVEKEENEGGHYSAHILIQKSPNELGHHLILAEKVPGVHIATIQSHFGWVCRDTLKRVHRDENGEVKEYSPVFDIVGYQSSTIQEALKTGTLQDIQLVKYEEKSDGLDEAPYHVEYKEQINVKKKLSDDEAVGLFDKIPELFSKIKPGEDNAHMFIRIKTSAGQTKTTEVEREKSAILEETFIQNEYVNGFDEPLTNRYGKIREDMLQKMISIAQNIDDN